MNYTYNKPRWRDAIEQNNKSFDLLRVFIYMWEVGQGLAELQKSDVATIRYITRICPVAAMYLA